MPRKPPIAQSREVKTADSFVGVEPEAEKRPPEYTKRITIAVSEEVHIRLKVACAARQLKMADVLRGWVEANVKTLEAA
jgi:ParG